MKNKCLCFLFLIILLIPIHAYSAEKMRIVVMNLKADGVADRTVRTISNMLRTELINLRKFTIVERAQMDAILKEQGLQQTGCTDQECAVEIGKLMSARKIMVGEVSHIGKSIVTTVRIVDVEKGISEFAATQKAQSEDDLDSAVSQIARQIAGRIEGETPVAKEVQTRKEVRKETTPEAPGGKSRAAYYALGLIPGLGQIYADRDVKGYIFLGTFVASTVLAVLAINSYNTTKKSYDDLGSTASAAEFNKKYDDYKKAATNAKIFSAVFGLVYVINWIDIIFLSAPNFDAKVGMQNYNQPYFTLNAYRTSLFTNEQQVDFGIGMKF
jgi:hypothetical protein